MKITVLSDNIGYGQFQGEWGLSFFIEYDGKKFLLDTGSSDNFLLNANKLGLDISRVDIAVLSHAHYDHSRGMDAFFKVNSNAPFYMSPNAGENCYAGWRFISRYIGLPKGVLTSFRSRIKTPDGIVQISDGVHIVPHNTPGLKSIGRKSHMYVRRGVLDYRVDDFSHEQSLVFKTDAGLVIMNSCSHAGADVIIEEVRRAFPSENVYAYIGGLHLFRLSDKDIEDVASRICRESISVVYTGHCTGERAYQILNRELEGNIHQFHCGMEITLT